MAALRRTPEWVGFLGALLRSACQAIRVDGVRRVVCGLLVLLAWWLVGRLVKRLGALR